MKAYDLYKQWQQMPPHVQNHVIGFFIGAVDMTAEGYTEPVTEQPHALWAQQEFANAVAYGVKQIEAEAKNWKCPVCNHVMTEDESKGYRGCPTGMHIAQHVHV